MGGAGRVRTVVTGTEDGIGGSAGGTNGGLLVADNCGGAVIGTEGPMTTTCGDSTVLLIDTEFDLIVIESWLFRGIAVG